MTVKHQKADTINVSTKQVAQPCLAPSKDITPPFGALGIPALTAATRNTPTTTPRKLSNEFTQLMRNPQNS